MKTLQLSGPSLPDTPTVWVGHSGAAGRGPDRLHTVGTAPLLLTSFAYPLFVLSPSWPSAEALARRLVADPQQIEQACVLCNQGRSCWHVPRWNRLRSRAWWETTPAQLGSFYTPP